MKILFFGGGLGNQLFEYAFYRYLKKKYPEEKIYGVYNALKLSEHNGLEIHKWFQVSLPPRSWMADAVTYGLFFNKRIFGNTGRLDLNQRRCLNEQALVFHAFKYTKEYFTQLPPLEWKSLEGRLSSRNRAVLEEIQTTDSVFVHVRRGDYLSPKYRDAYAGTCPLSYYEKAIGEVRRRLPEARFFVFSDDMAWAKAHLPLSEATYVDWNVGKDSPIDLYLMGQCQVAVMANSTFSYWGAVLGRKKQLVFYPEKWINEAQGNPDIFFEDWMAY